VYNKGAEVVRMMHTLLGEDGFRRGMDLYFQRHDGQAVTCDDFRAAMADANGADLVQFERWYAQSGTPIVEVEGSHDAAKKQYTLALHQRAPVNTDDGEWKPMHVPLLVGLLGPDGRDLPLAIAEGPAQVRGTTALVELREPDTRVVFSGVAAPPVPSLLRNFSAPVKLRFERTTDELAFIMAHDADSFSRWDAAQTLAEATISALVRERAEGRPLTIDDRFIAAFGRIIADPALDGSLRSLMMTLPDERVLAQHASVVDVDGIHEARQLVLAKLAAAHRETLHELYERERPRGAYENSQRSIASRRAKNAALRYLVTGKRPEAIELALAQFRSADNMTDVQAALLCLVDCEGDVCDAPVAEFYARWKHDALVLDKWFATQAVSIRKDTLARVTALRNHADFNIKNPNRVRALLGTFSVRNQVRFHERSGAGYRLLADAVLELDAINPQVAARLVGPFVQWRRLDEVRSEAMRAELARIVARPRLSKDVFELASKALAD
jgi:aminopeptidase N